MEYSSIITSQVWKQNRPPIIQVYDSISDRNDLECYINHWLFMKDIFSGARLT